MSPWREEGAPWKRREKLWSPPASQACLALAYSREKGASFAAPEYDRYGARYRRQACTLLTLQVLRLSPGMGSHHQHTWVHSQWHTRLAVPGSTTHVCSKGLQLAYPCFGSQLLHSVLSLSVVETSETEQPLIAEESGDQQETCPHIPSPMHLPQQEGRALPIDQGPGCSVTGDLGSACWKGCCTLQTGGCHQLKGHRSRAPASKLGLVPRRMPSGQSCASQRGGHPSAQWKASRKECRGSHGP